VYSVTGVINDAGTNLATYFLCTSTSDDPQTVGVELFAAARIISTSTSLICTAFLRDYANSTGPIAELTIVKKAKQKGD
jgi:hypothetical protein